MPGGRRGTGVNSGMGRSLIRQQRHTSDRNRGVPVLSAPITEPVSITEPTDLQAFMQRADLLNADFEADHDEYRLLGPREVAANREGALGAAERRLAEQRRAELRHELRVPRRPVWTEGVSSEEQDEREKTAFCEWQAAMSKLEADRALVMTPFERNLEVWRQLWRVVERCDTLVQIVDARDPLLYRCEDLELYAQEVSSDKCNLLLLNKADLLTAQQRRGWASHFREIGVRALFFSAVAEELHETEEDEDSRVLTREELLEVFKTSHLTSNKITVGLIGYPNVGKSSTLNTLLQSKKVSVSATPGKTKHFQTLHVDENLVLCDCPGLVLPNMAATKAQLLLAGVLPVDQMRDCLPPVALLCRRLGRVALRRRYGLLLPLSEQQRLEAADEEGDMDSDEEDPGVAALAPPTAEEFLSEHATRRGFMTESGNPHLDRSARIVLKEYIGGEDGLRFCVPPPGVSVRVFNPLIREEELREAQHTLATEQEVLSDFDKHFFMQKSAGFGYKGVARKDAGSGGSGADKSWKKHNNKRKKEKLRRVHSDLDAN